jgi:catechol 2,3-dioxygenase
MSELPFAATTPVSIGRIGLKARNANLLADYYTTILGLKELQRSGDHIVLGTEGRPLLDIEGSASLREDDPRSAGLYHTAFLFPERADLARWVNHAIEQRFRIDGAADHDVSEALYLTDPEGNGVEIYADRPRHDWTFNGPSVHMGTDALNIQALLDTLSSEDSNWTGSPEGTVVGHVHLRVGDVRAAEAWWNDAQGFDTMLNYGGQAVFLSTGGYHHHIGANSWQSRDSGPREQDRTGLSFVELLSKGATDEHVASDPWGTEIRLIPAKE